MLCLAICGTITINLSPWHRYRENPTVISIERDYDNWNTSLPSVTLCPLQKYNLTAIQNFMSRYNRTNGNPELINFLKLLPNLTYSNFNHAAKYNKDYIDPSQYLDVIHKIRFELRYYAESSTGSKGTSVMETVNEQGFCFTFISNVAVFNSYQYVTSNLWDGHHEGNAVASNYLSEDEISLSDMNSGAELDHDDFLLQYFGWQPFSHRQVYVHSPDEPAQMTSRVATVGPSESAHVYLQATAVRASPEVWGLRLAQRRCRFPWESPLPTTPVYSYAACRIYCRLLLARRLCGCAPHFYKRTDSHPVCDIEGMKCLFENRHMLQRLAENETGDSVCSCLPQCEGSKYVLASTQRYNWNLGAQLTWGLQKYPHMRMRRDVIFGFTDLLVSTGGSLGLFLGCSVLTLAEVLYLLVYRPFAAVVCKLLRKKWLQRV